MPAVSLFRALLVTATVMLLVCAGAARADDGIWAALTSGQRDKVLQTLANELGSVYDGVTERRGRAERDKKTLEEILAELGEKPGAFERYAGMALNGLRGDAAKFATMAGEASAGNFQPMLEAAPRWGAALFADLVGERLGQLGYKDTKYVWQALVSRAGALEQVGVAFMRGDWGQALEALKAQARKESQQIATAAIADAIDWVFSDSPVKLGAPYVALIENEIAFLAWSRTVIGNRRSGPCLDRYVAEYNRGGGQEAAMSAGYEAFEECMISNTFGFWNIEAYITQAELDPRRVYYALLEGYRTQHQWPDEWLERELAAQKRAAEGQLGTELAHAQSTLDVAGRLFVAAVGRRVRELIDEQLSEEERKKLEAAARQALADTARDLGMLRDARIGAVAACKDFAQAKGTTLRELERLEKAVDAAVVLGRSLDRLQQCRPAARQDSTDRADRLGKAAALRQEIATRSAAAEQAMSQACAAREKMGAADPMDEERWTLGEAAWQANEAVKLEGAAGEEAFTALEQLLGGAASQDQAAADLATELQALETLLREYEQAGPDEAAAAFASAKKLMDGAQRRAANLTSFGEEKAKLLRAALEPHRTGPLGEDVSKILAEVNEAVQEAQLCTGGVIAEWTASDGGEAAWRSRNGPELPSVEGLRQRVAETKKRCGTAVQDPQLLEIVQAASADAALIDLAQQSAERCLAEAVAVVEAGLKGDPERALPPAVALTIWGIYQEGQCYWTVDLQRVSKPTQSPPGKNVVIDGATYQATYRSTWQWIAKAVAPYECEPRESETYAGNVTLLHVGGIYGMTRDFVGNPADLGTDCTYAADVQQDGVNLKGSWSCSESLQVGTVDEHFEGGVAGSLSSQ